MTLPVLMSGLQESVCRQIYESRYCAAPIVTHDGVTVYFRKENFDHAFFEGTHKPGQEFFSLRRAEYVYYIEYALKSVTATRYQGWNKKKSRYESDRMVAVTVGDFVVVLGMYLNARGDLCAKFITCYVADNSIAKIKASPLWDRHACEEGLRKKRGR